MTGGGSFNNSSSLDIRALNVGKIPAAQEAINAYIEMLKGVIKKIQAANGEIVYTQGIAGDEQKIAAENYVDTATAKITTIIEKLNNFNLALEQVKANYSKQSGDVAGDISAKAGVMEGETIAKVNTGVQGFSD